MADVQRKGCRYCHNLIPTEALKCGFCHEWQKVWLWLFYWPPVQIALVAFVAFLALEISGSLQNSSEKNSDVQNSKSSQTIIAKNFRMMMNGKRLMVVGDLENQSESERRGVRVDVIYFNSKNEESDRASEYLSGVKPGKSKFMVEFMRYELSDKDLYDRFEVRVDNGY